MRLIWLAVVLTISVVIAPLAAGAQKAERPHRVGFLTGPTGTGTTFFDAFRQGLQELGWKEGQNIALEYRVTQSEQMPKVAEEMVRTQDLIVLTATAIQRAREATATVPVVFVIADDPVGAGFVSSLARPCGLMTGLTSLNVDLDAKRLEILKLALPNVARVEADIRDERPRIGEAGERAEFADQGGGRLRADARNGLQQFGVGRPRARLAGGSSVVAARSTSSIALVSRSSWLTKVRMT